MIWVHASCPFPPLSSDVRQHSANGRRTTTQVPEYSIVCVVAACADKQAGRIFYGLVDTKCPDIVDVAPFYPEDLIIIMKDGYS